ncbi:tetratricopeptide repeat protein 33 [Amia ocellicauda]|uniref:tetratricopeptide repeat protein 33 n=1 Tax=Amia ocellicauda TaxID=2972642 RepID=UPI003463B3A5
MASFGWKRKAGEKVSQTAVRRFEAEVSGEQAIPEREGVDWLHAIKRRRAVLLEDCATKSRRLKDEGAVLAEQGRNWEAIKRWEEAIQITPEDASLHEMKAQVLSLLQELFPAVQAAERAVSLNPRWWEAWQTLGRAQLSLGELDLAMKSFQTAIHLAPAERPLWEEDLRWGRRLQDERRAAVDRAQREEEAAQRLLAVPELVPDYDFEGDEVVAACTAVEQRQREYERLGRSAAVVDTGGEGRGGGSSSQQHLVKARGP